MFQDATEPFGVQATVTLKTNYWDTKVNYYYHIKDAQIKMYCYKIIFLYQEALIQTFHNSFDNKITSVSSQYENTNAKGDFVPKNQFER